MSLFQYEREGNARALIEALRTSDNPEIRARAASMLGSLEDTDERDEIVKALVEVAQSGEGPVVAAAVDALDQHGTDAIQALLTRMSSVDIADDAADWVRAKAFTQALSAEVPELRMAAANALGDIGEAEIMPKLVGRFEDPDPRVRARAARACGEIDDARAVEPLTGLLGDPKAAVRREAAEALGRIGNRQALQALLGMYTDDNERVRRIAVAGFGKFENDRPIEALSDALGDRSAAVRQAAVYSLIELLSNVPTEQSHELRETVLEELSAREDGTVVKPLIEVLTESTQPAQRRNSAWLLGQVAGGEGDRAVVKALIDALGDDDGMTRQFAATSLTTIGGDYAERALLDVAEDEQTDSEERAQAVFALGKVGGEEARRRLDALLDKTEDEQVREKAFAALSKLGGQVE
jgi:HEAT repeat protein